MAEQQIDKTQQPLSQSPTIQKQGTSYSAGPTKHDNAEYQAQYAASNKPSSAAYGDNYYQTRASELGMLSLDSSPKKLPEMSVNLGSGTPVSKEVVKPTIPVDSKPSVINGGYRNESVNPRNLDYLSRQSSPSTSQVSSKSSQPTVDTSTTAPKPAGITGSASNYGYKPPNLTAGLGGSVSDVPNPSAMSGIGVQSTVGNLAQPLQAGLMKGLPQTNYSFGLPSLDMNNI